VANDLPVVAPVRAPETAGVALPYARLVRNRPLCALVLAQMVSSLGDRLHEVVLAVLVLGLSGQPAMAVLVFLVGTAPRFLLGPVAGVVADRYERRRLMICADLARASLVLLVPLAAVASPVATLPLTFLLTSVGLVFRPARLGMLQRIVEPGEVVEANAASMAADVVADLAGYPIAALVTVLLAPVLWVAFVADSASFLVSAVLLLGLPTSQPPWQPVSVSRDLRDGVGFLRRDPVLFENTLLLCGAQTAVAATISLAVVYCEQTLRDGILPYPANYSAVLLAETLGALAGAVLVGAVGTRIGTGWVLLAGCALQGIAVAALAFVASTPIAIVAMAVSGAANLLWIVPIQSMFVQRSPDDLVGRVTAASTALTAVAATVAMAAFSVLASWLPAAEVLGMAGAVTLGMTALGVARSAIRRPDRVPLRTRPTAA
jgi:predicted MFS family arabinose efflux permease